MTKLEKLQKAAAEKSKTMVVEKQGNGYVVYETHAERYWFKKSMNKKPAMSYDEAALYIQEYTEEVS